MAEYSADAIQVVNPNESIVFTNTPVPCPYGLVRHREESGAFLLSGRVANRHCAGCDRNKYANYLVDFSANIAIPTGGTVEPITVAITIDGSTIPASTMEVTPAAVEQFFNVSRAINAQIMSGCCESVSIVNTSTQPISVRNANVIFSRSDANRLF